MADPRKLSFIIVPHDKMETRNYEISYGLLKVLLGVAFLLVLVFVLMLSSWWLVATQAARVTGLEEQVASLEEERSQVQELARNLAIAEQQYEQVRRLLGVEASRSPQEVALPPLRAEGASTVSVAGESARPTAWPLTRAGFITQRRQVTGTGTHPGLDIAVPTDSYIRSAGSGTVMDAGVDEVYGRHILIDHGDGLQSMYGHASRLFVEPGEVVERNQVIALSGSTGRSTAPHLHFEIRRDGEPVDPLAYVRQPS